MKSTLLRVLFYTLKGDDIMEENEVKSRELIGNVEIKSFMFSEGLT